MADYLTTDTELTSIANAIRTKGGTSAQLAFPSEFISAINAISGGGGGTSYKALIVKNGTYGNINITHNSTTYTTAGDYFYFSQGDIITIVQNFGDSNEIYIDGVKVESAYYSGASYNYTAPDHDILIAISGSSALENFGKTEVTEDSTLRVLKPDSLSADANATYTAQPGHAYSAVTVNVPTSGNSKNVQVVQGTTRTVSASMSAIGAELTVSKTGTYDVYWSAFRSSTSSSYTYASQLYVDGSAYGSENSTWTNHVQNNHLSNVSLTANQKIRVYGRESRSSSYYVYAPTLVIVES